MRKKESICIILFSGWIFPLIAQPELPGGFTRLARETSIELILPADAGYKAFELKPDEFQPCQAALFSRREKLELRYLLEPFDSTRADLSLPGVYTGRLLLHLASNEEDAVIAGHILDDTTLQTFNADWGKLFFFRPKAAFSPRKHCQLLALAKDGKGIALVFFLTDNADNVALEKRFQALRFFD